MSNTLPKNEPQTVLSKADKNVRAPILVACILMLILGLGQHALAHGDLYLRVQDLTKRIEEAGTNAAPVYLERGELKREHGDFAGAGEDFEAASRLEPNSAMVNICRARLMTSTGAASDAFSILDRMASLHPRLGTVFIDRGHAKAKLEDLSGSAADFRKGIELSDGVAPEIFMELAQVLAKSGKTNEAIEVLNHGAKTTEQPMDLLIQALELELQSGNTNAAVTRIDEVAKVSLRKERWWAQKGELLAALGKNSEAKAAYVLASNALSKLPPRLQQTPGSVALKTKIETALANLESRNIQ